MQKFKLSINLQSSAPKYRQIINQVVDAAGSGELKPGDRLPSVNHLIKELDVSRDTVFKAYEYLREIGCIDAIHGKGYFIHSAKVRVLLFLDKYSPFKEGLYNALRQNLPTSYTIDLYFHHYNQEVFKNVLETAVGRYNFFVIMSFNKAEVGKVLSALDRNKVLILDLKHHAPVTLPYICQDFEDELYKCLEEAKERIVNYEEFHFILRPESHHPEESAKAFMRFCKAEGIKGRVTPSLDVNNVAKNQAYLLVTDDDLVSLIELSKYRGYIPGKDIGILSYNDTPVKKVIADGISVVSTDFAEMGKSVSEYLKNRVFTQKIIPTRLIMRSSL